MKSTLRNISLLLVVLISIVHGQIYAGTPVWIHDAKIKSITVQPSGIIYIVLDNASDSTKEVPNLNCTSYDKSTLELNPNATFFKEQYSLLMSAHLASRAINVYVSGCGNLFPLAQNTRIL